MEKIIFIGISGASGVIYGIRLLKFLRYSNIKTVLSISDNAKKIVEVETSFSVDDLKNTASFYYDNDDLFSPFASGSVMFDSAVIVPCSMKTIGSIASGVYSNLITRVAHISLKEGRKLILVPRETPYSLIDLKNLVVLKESGACILPASPGFYGQPQTVDDIVNFIVGKILDQLGIENNLIKRWGD